MLIKVGKGVLNRYMKMGKTDSDCEIDHRAISKEVLFY